MKRIVSTDIYIYIYMILPFSLNKALDLKLEIQAEYSIHDVSTH